MAQQLAEMVVVAKVMNLSDLKHLKRSMEPEESPRETHSSVYRTRLSTCQSQGHVPHVCVSEEVATCHADGEGHFDSYQGDSHDTR